MAIYVGSARISEHGTIDGSPGDSTGKEVMKQTFYVHPKGWYVLRARSISVANALASAMNIACENNNIGYSQRSRYGVVSHGVRTKVKTNADCSSLVRACCRYAGFDPGDFNTANEKNVLYASGHFLKPFTYEKGTKLYNGDILVTKTKGHTVIVVSGSPRKEYFPNYKGQSVSIVTALQAVGASYSFSYRKKIATANGIKSYTGTADQNRQLLSLLKKGELLKP